MSRKIKATRALVGRESSPVLITMRQEELNFWYCCYLLHDSEPAVMGRFWLSRKIRESERVIAIINVELKKRGDFVELF